MYLEEIPADAPTISKVSDVEKMQSAMKKQIPPMELARQFIQQE